jgi:hypothetical protein
MASMKFGVYEVEISLRDSQRLIVSFAGIGDIDSGEMPYEWQDSLSDWNDNISYIFIRDTSRSWYTNESGISSLAQWLNELIFDLNISYSIGFGLSMGGYGALILDSLVKFDLTVAISSRTYLGRESQFDNRLTELSELVTSSQKTNAYNLLRDVGNYIFLYSIDDINDMMHASRLYFIKPQNVKMFSTRGPHNIGYNEKKIRGLKPLLSWLFLDNCASPLEGFKPFTLDTAVIASTLEKMNFPESITASAYEEYFQHIAPADIPELILVSCAQHSLDSHIRTCLTHDRHQRESIFSSSRLHLSPIVSLSHLTVNSFARNLTLGWSDPEEDGCWAIGIWHFIEGSIIDSGIGPYQLRVDYRVYLPPESSQTINFYDEDGLMCIESVHHKYGRDAGTVFIPLRTPYLFKILIETANPLMPSACSSSEDTRELSIFVTSLTVISTTL